MLKFYNTLGRKKQEFKTLKGNEVRMYTCGPTVYNYAHIGNFRTYVFEDILRRYLKFKGFKVTQVMNLTDVDDKTIKGSKKEGIPLKEFTEKYINAFFEDIDALGIERAEHYPAATDYVNQMVEIVKKLLEKGIAYKSDDKCIYFDIAKFPEYGKLARINVKELKAGARVKQDEYDKDNASDFVLWKAWTEEDGDVFWETELGKGRPGWHIECSAMSLSLLGNHFDIHTGGVDNMFPHHENEIAQSEASTGEKFVEYWLHSEHLLVDNKKMSKSMGNFYTLRDLTEKELKPKAIRYVLAYPHYKQQMNFAIELVKEAEKTIKRMNNFIQRVKEAKGEQGNAEELAEKFLSKFEEAMDDDLNTPLAFAAVFEFMKEINKLLAENNVSEKESEIALNAMKKADSVMNVMDFEKKEQELAPELMKLVKEREEARKNKNWAKADELRDRLKEHGITLIDSKDRTKWKTE